ncbi:hypothetical protein D9M69_663820 [compost metagenome]
MPGHTAQEGSVRVMYHALNGGFPEVTGDLRRSDQPFGLLLKNVVHQVMQTHGLVNVHAHKCVKVSAAYLLYQLLKQQQPEIRIHILISCSTGQCTFFHP